ncbi:MAG: LCP family protein [Coriobacteriia bacterium]|nr:LCP family protein [Coriobacteriia bacterium]
MAGQNWSNRTSRSLHRNEINLVTARSALSDDAGSYSRSARGNGYAKQRSKRAFRRRILIGISVTLIATLIAGTTAAFGFAAYLNDMLSRTASGAGLNIQSIRAVTIDRQAPEDPFWMILAGTDWDEDDNGNFRTDVIILTYVHPGNKVAALISIPRDTMVLLEGYGIQKINAAYTYGELEGREGLPNSGPALLIKTVSDLVGVDISAYAQVDFAGFVGVVDALGGVTVDVKLDIIGDREAGPVDVYAGEQVLDGQSALVFVRSRQYEIGDFQRQANQRAMLQAIAKEVLCEDPLTIINTVTKIAEMTTSSMKVDEIGSIASSLRGMQEGDIYTYSLPSELATRDGISFVVIDEYATRDLISSINAGIFPDYSTQTYQGEVADRYLAAGRAKDLLANAHSTVDTSLYSVSVRNGYGYAGSANAVSSMLTLAGYEQLEIGNANAYVYTETLIIYRDDADQEAAIDIRNRLGYGRVIPSLGRYSFEGNILVVVGADFAG